MWPNSFSVRGVGGINGGGFLVPKVGIEETPMVYFVAYGRVKGDVGEPGFLQGVKTFQENQKTKGKTRPAKQSV